MDQTLLAGGALAAACRSRGGWRRAGLALAAGLLAGAGCGASALGQTRIAGGVPGPVTGYLTVEPYELRQEFILSFEAVSGQAGVEAGEIHPGNRAALEEAFARWLAGKCPVEVDGVALPLELDRIHFVRTDPELGLVVEDRERVPASEALVGAVFAAALDGPPRRLRVVWEIFPGEGGEAVVEAGARGQSAARRLTPESPELIWEDALGLAAPHLMELPPVPRRQGLARGEVARLVFFGAVALVSLAAAAGAGGWKRRTTAGIGCVALLVGSLDGAGLARSRPLAVGPELADEVCYALLRNIYHSFDYRRETDIYDTLERSASGELLTRIYLEVRRSLEVESQGGARVRVTDLDLRRCEVVEAAPGGFTASCDWVAVGTVTHWGHTHDRVNRYRARLEIAEAGGEWRLTGLDLESEERIQAPAQAAAPGRGDSRG